MNHIHIQEVKKNHFPDFFAYLNAHIAENGKKDLVFLPISPAHSFLNEDFKEK